MPPDLHEIYRLEQENNRMLRAMRRHAMWGTVFRVLLFLLALGIPIWLYLSYLAPVLKQLESTVNQATGTKIQIEDQFGEWMKAWDEFKAKFGGSNASSTAAQ